MNNQKQRLIRNVFQHQAVPGGDNKDDAGVWQDKNAAARKRAATSQPVTPVKPLRTQTANADTSTVTHQPGSKRKRAYIMLWVNPVVKEELERRARRNRISLSAAGGALLERAMQQDIDMEYGALLEPVIRQEISRQMRNYSSRLALLIVRDAFATEQTRSILTEVLRLQFKISGVPQDEVEDEVVKILDWSADLAKSKIAWKTPELEEAVSSIEGWFTEKQDKEETE
jgi:hypothetical protein